MNTQRQFDRLFCLLACMVAMMGLPVGLNAQTPPTAEPPTKPILRIETGMHTATIRRIAVDKAGRYIVTGSHDKTVRVWERSTGALLRTLRPPIGEGNEGKIDAVALSPDGNTIACGGWTGYEWDKQVCIYLFDRESGQLIRRIPGLPNVVHHLAFSNDGRFLVATVGDNGIRVFRISDSSVILEDKEYGDNSEGADFDEAGRLVTSCYDGYIRLYSAEFKLLAKVKAPGGEQPFSVAFSPRGTHVAVGYNSSLRVDVLSGSDLTMLYSPDTSDLKGGDLGIVCWSADGGSLFAGGTYGNSGCPVLRWTDTGKGPRTILQAADNTITDLKALPDGGVAFGSADPAFGVLDASGKRTLFQPPSIADFRNNLTTDGAPGLLLSGDGSTVQFGYEAFGKSPARFSLDRHVLDVAPSEEAVRQGSLHPPITHAADLNIVYEYTAHPTLNGKPIALEKYEMSRCLAIAPDQQLFLLGTDWYLRCFDRSGKEKWTVPAPGGARCVNIASDGKTAVAGFGDGTLRWFRMSDGKVLLSFFPHADRKRWVLWSPSGYYDCSAGGEDLIGWHRNNGKDAAADFFPASRFREAFYRPDVLAKILETGDEAEALRLANEESGKKHTLVEIDKTLPPVVRIVTPTDGVEAMDPTLTVKVALRSPSGEPITEVRALVDGRPVPDARRLEEISVTDNREETRELTVALPDHDCVVSVVAANKYATSVEAKVRVTWKGAVVAAKPRLYILAAGVSKYQEASLALNFAAQDATDFADFFAKQEGTLYSKVTIRQLTDGAATREAILSGLDWLSKQTTSRDVAMFFFSGHGTRDNNGKYYFIPVDYVDGKVHVTAIPQSEIQDAITNLPGKVLFFMDTCRSGAAGGQTKPKGPPQNLVGIINELASAENGTVVFSASTGSENAQEDPSWGHGAFTKALLEGLGGLADAQHTGRVTITLLDAYIAERVKVLTGGTQHPTTRKPDGVPDFPIAVVP